MSIAPEFGPLRGQKLISSDGATVGTIEDVYIDGDTGDAGFLEVKTGGRLRAKKSVVPLQGAQDEGDAVRVPYAAEQIKSAPSVEAPAGGELAADEQAAVLEHYRLDPDAEHPGR